MSNREPKNAIVKAGERFAPKALAVLRKRRVELTEEVVQPKSDIRQGQWMCVDCGDILANNLEIWGHPKKHRIGWWTGTQVEEP